MGSSNPVLRGIVSNATPYDILVEVTTRDIRTVDRTTSTSWFVTTFFRPHPNVTTHLAGNITEQQIPEREVSKFTVSPKRSNQRMLNFKLGDDKTYYLTIKTVPTGINQQKILIENLAVTQENEKAIRICSWVDKGKIICSEVVKDTEWRLAGDKFRNYPPGEKCEICDEELKCKNHCTNFRKFGGLSMGEAMTQLNDEEVTQRSDESTSARSWA